MNVSRHILIYVCYSTSLIHKLLVTVGKLDICKCMTGPLHILITRSGSITHSSSPAYAMSKFKILFYQ